MMSHNWWVINDESPDNPCIWSRGNLYPFFWCKWYLVSSFQICVGGLLGDDVMMTSSSQPQKSVSFITWFLWCLFRVTFWIKQAFTKQWSEHQFNVPYHVTHTVTWWKHVTSSEWRHPVFVTWLWGHMIFRFILFWNVQIGRNSLVTSAYTCGGLRVRFQQFLKNVAILLATPFTFVRVSFVQKQYDPQLTIDYLLNESASSGGNHTRAPSYQVHQNH